MSSGSKPNHSLVHCRLGLERLEERLNLSFEMLPTWAELAHLDVNGDQAIHPVDVVLVINELNLPDGVGPVESPGLDDDRITARRKMNTNGDSLLSPVDALLVINYLNNPVPTVIDEFVERSLAYFMDSGVPSIRRSNVSSGSRL